MRPGCGPTTPVPHVALAAALKDHGELDAAIAEARDTIRLLPYNVAAQVTSGTT